MTLFQRHRTTEMGIRNLACCSCMCACVCSHDNLVWIPECEAYWHQVFAVAHFSTQTCTLICSSLLLPQQNVEFVRNSCNYRMMTQYEYNMEVGDITFTPGWVTAQESIRSRKHIYRLFSKSQTRTLVIHTQAKHRGEENITGHTISESWKDSRK